MLYLHFDINYKELTEYSVTLNMMESVILERIVVEVPLAVGRISPSGT